MLAETSFMYFIKNLITISVSKLIMFGPIFNVNLMLVFKNYFQELFGRFLFLVIKQIYSILSRRFVVFMTTILLEKPFSVSVSADLLYKAIRVSEISAYQLVFSVYTC